MQTIKNQWDTVLNSGRIPVFEFELSDGDYLTVELSYSDSGIVFRLDVEGEEHFSGNITSDGNKHTYMFDEYFESLDYYLQEIYQEVVEGFIIPNDLKVVG